MRIRSIHPGIWVDEIFVELSIQGRLFYIGLLNACDDAGCFQWKPLTLKMLLAPADSVDVAGILHELTELGFVQKYQVDGAVFGAVRNFMRFQRPEKPRYVHPRPDGISEFVGHGGNTHTGSAKRLASLGKGLAPGPATDRRADSSGPSTVNSASNPGLVTDALPTDRQRLGDSSVTSPRILGQREKEREREEKEESPSKLKTKATTNREPRASLAEFEKFWLAYPRRVGKDAARKAFVNAMKRATFAEIMAGLARATWNADPKYRPHPGTWLNSGCWQDEPDASSTPSADTKRQSGGQYSPSAGRVLTDEEMFEVAT